MPRTFPPAPAWSANGHRIKAPLDYSRGPEKTWVYGALRVRDGKELTRCAASRNSTNYIALLKDIEADNPAGDLFIITDNLSSHTSAQTRTWLAEHPRLHQVFIPTGARLCSICKRAGGGSSAAMLWLDRVLLPLMRSSRPHASRRLNSTDEPSPGSGVGLAIRSPPLPPTLFLSPLSSTLSKLGCKNERLDETLEQSPRDFYNIVFSRRQIRKCHWP